MPLPINIDDLLRRRKIEPSGIEFKRRWKPDKIYQSVCAFANDFDNIGGGYIVVGVEEENGIVRRPVVGINLKKLDKIQRAMIGFNNKIVPYYVPRPDVEELDGKFVLVICVPAGVNRPYSVKERVTARWSEYKCYIRSGTSNIEANGEVLDKLREMATRTPFDERGNPNIAITDISPALVMDYLQTVNSRLVHDFENKPFAEILDCMDLFTGPTERRLLKNVAAMMFCTNPAKFFPATQVDITIFPEGCSKNPNNIIKVPKIVGTIPEMIEQTLTYIKANVIKKRILKSKDKAEATTYFNYPYQAIEEAVVNALYHRDYQERKPVKIAIEPDKISVLSFSGPDRSISRADLQKAEHLKSRRCRNRRLGEYLKELQLSEGRATGIPTIQNELRKNGSALARIKTDDSRSYFMIEIPCRKGFGDVTEIENDKINDLSNDNINDGIETPAEPPIKAIHEPSDDSSNELSNDNINGDENDKIESAEASIILLSSIELAILRIVAKSAYPKRKYLVKSLKISYSTLDRALKALTSPPLTLIAYQGPKKTGGYVLTERGRDFLKIN